MIRISAKMNWENYWKEKSNVSELYSNQSRILQNLASIIDLTGKKVLEVGAGTGRDSFSLVEHGAFIYLFDYAWNSLKIIKQLALERKADIHLICGNAFRLPFKDGSYDIVFHQGLYEHFRKPEAEEILRENIRVLKQDGILLIDVPQKYHIYTAIKHILMVFNTWFAGWEREFTVRELEMDMKKQGLLIIRSYGEWMYPSIFYKITREVLLRFGVRIPLYPANIRHISELRRRIREILLQHGFFLNTCHSIGVVGRKA